MSNAELSAAEWGCPAVQACEQAVFDSFSERLRTVIAHAKVMVSAIDVANLMAELDDDENMGIKAVRMAEEREVAKHDAELAAAGNRAERRRDRAEERRMLAMARRHRMGLH